MRGLLRGKHFLNLISETKFQDLILNFKSYQKFDFKFSRFPPSLYIYLLLSPSQFICFVCEFILTVIIFFSSRCRKQQAGQTPPTEAFRDRPVPTGRLNIYSKPDILPFIQHVLRNTEELQYIKNSCFGKLFELPARQCPVSCKLIHAFLTR